MHANADLGMAVERLGLKSLQRKWGWFVALGIALILLGTIALGAAVFFTLLTVVFFGVLLLIAGGVQVVEAFGAGQWSGFFWHLLIGLLYIVGGLAAVIEPLPTSIWLTLFLGFAILFNGVLRSVMAFQLREMPNWGWMLLSGIVAVFLGLVIVAKWPISGLVVIGLFVAIELIISGWSCIVIGLMARHSKKLMEETADWSEPQEQPL